MFVPFHYGHHADDDGPTRTATESTARSAIPPGPSHGASSRVSGTLYPRPLTELRS